VGGRRFQIFGRGSYALTGFERVAAGHDRTSVDSKSENGVRRFGRMLRGLQVLNGLVLLGVTLRLWEYFFNRSLYLDEILLTRSIVGMPLRELLTKPLLMDQVAPRGFLLVERLAVTILGPSELALRLFPFLSGVASVILFRRLATRVLTGAGPALALFLFAIGVPLIRYGGDVKQYAVDIAAAIGLLLVALDLREKEATTRRLLLAGAGAGDRVVLAGGCAGDGRDWARLSGGLVDIARPKSVARTAGDDSYVGCGVDCRCDHRNAKYDAINARVHGRFLGGGIFSADVAGDGSAGVVLGAIEFDFFRS
jgi:hypothetical protein